MYILRLLLLLILSLFQPILSERRLIDGRYSRLWRSTCADKLVSLHDKYRSDKSIPENRRLNDLHEISLKEHRYEVRDAGVATELLSGERHSERLILALHRRSLAAVERQQDRRVIGTIKNFNGQDHLGTLRENVHNTYNSLNSRLFYEEPEERIRLGKNSAKLFERKISKRDLTRKFEEVHDHFRTSRDRQDSVNIRNNEHFLRQKYTHMIRNKDIVQASDAYIAKMQNRSIKVERRPEDNTMASTEGKIYQKFLAQSKDRHILSNLNKKLSESLKQANRITEKSTVYDDDRSVTKMFKSLSRHNIHEIYIPTEHGVRPSIARRHENKRSNSNRAETYVSIRDELTDITTGERYAKYDNSERFISIKYDRREHTNKKNSGSLREQRNKRAIVINDERNVRDSERKSIYIQRKLREGKSRAQNILIVRNHEKRNVENNSRDNKRIAKNQSDVRRVIDKNIVRSCEAWTIYKESDNPIDKRYKRNVRDHPFDREINLNVGRIIDGHVRRNRVTKNTNVNEALTLENEKTYAKDNTCKESTFSKCEVPQGPQRTTNIPATSGRELISNKQHVRSEDKNSFKDNTGQTVIVIEREKSKSGARISREHFTCTIRSNVRNSAVVLKSYGFSDTYIACNEGKRNSNVREQRTKTVRESLSSDRDESQTNMESLVQRHVARVHGERMLKARNEYTSGRNVARYPKDVSREQAVSVKRNVRQQPAIRINDIHIDNRQQDRRTNMRNERNNIKNNIRLLRENKSEKAFSRARGVLDVHIVRNREEQNAQYASTERTSVKNTERYLAGTSFEKDVLHGLELRQSDVSRNMAKIRFSTEREDQRYSRIHVRGRPIHTEQKERLSYERRDVNKHSRRGYERISIVAINERIGNGKIGKYLPDSTRGRTFSIEGIHKSDLIRAVDIQSGHSDEERKSEVKSKRTIIKNDDRERCKPKVIDRSLRQNANVHNKFMHVTNDEKYSKNNMHDRVIPERHNGRQSKESKINMKHTLRTHAEQTTGFEDRRHHMRKSEYYIRNYCDHIIVSAGRETCLNKLNRTIDDNTISKQELNINLRITRVAKRGVRGVTQRQSRETYFARSERHSRTFNSRKTIAAGIVRNSRPQRYRTRDILQIRESEEIPMQLTAYEYNHGRQSNDMHRDVLSDRDHSRRNTEFFRARNAMARKGFDSQNEITKNNSDMLFYWQYLFYAIQGLYTLVVFMRVLVQKENDKTSSRSWLTSTAFIKVD